tara:strand:+ start:1464 stop:3107 length:1644 start_codon:yes stop_codon:yes gene_type:complete
MASEALAKEPEDSAVEDMRLILRMIELALRNVDVAYDEEQNAYFRDVWSRLQSRLLCLRCSATSASWKPQFLALLHRARFFREKAFTPFGVSVLSNFDNDTDPSMTRSPTGCFACANTKELSAKTIQEHGVFELVGNTIWRERCDNDFLLTCPPQNLRERLTERFKTDKRIASFDTEEVQQPNPFYRGMFVAGAKCTRLAGAFVWLQNFLPDLAHRIEKELEEGMTEEMLERPPDEVSVITKTMAYCVVAQLEEMETFLREDVDRVEAVAMPPKIKLLDGDIHETYIHEQEYSAWHNVDAVNGSINTKKGEAVSASLGGVPPDKPTWFEEARHGDWTLVRWMWMCSYQDNLKRAMASMQTKIPHKPSPTTSAHSTPEEDPSEDEDGEEDDDETTDETSEADERTLRRMRRERFRRKRRERTMQAESEPPPRRRRAAVVEDEDEQEEEEEEEEAETGEAEAQTDDDGHLEDEAQNSFDNTEVNMAVFDAREGMLCEIVRRAHESTAYKMRLAVDQGSVAGTCKAQREYEAQMDMARHLQTTFKLGRIV